MDRVAEDGSFRLKVTRSNINVILSGVAAEQSEAAAQSKDPARFIFKIDSKGISTPLCG
jgi:hypothetical protein